MRRLPLQVLFTIFKEISKHIPTITWLDILRVREYYPGSPEEMIKILYSLYVYPADCCPDCHLNYTLYSAPAGCRKCALAQPPATCVPFNGYRAAYHPPVAGARYQHSAAVAVDHLPFANGHYHHHVPTAKLIDYEDTLDGYPPPTLSASRRHVPASVERWNWMNDCGPSSSYRYHESRYVPSSSSESVSYDEESVRTRLPRPSLERGGTASGAGVNDSHSSSRKRDQSSCSESSHRARSASDEKTETAPSNSNAVAAPSASSEPESDAKSACIGEETSSTFTWECRNCTFYNPLRNNVCEMCGKSRNASEEASLVSGGKQCKFCTLVNQREATKCEACDNSLENSPTYV